MICRASLTASGVALLLGLGGGATQAQSMIAVSDICADPMTTGPAKLPAFEAAGWTRLPQSTIHAVTAIANAHVASFTGSDLAWPQRYELVAPLAGNFNTMITDGAITLWAKGDAYLAVSIQQTPAGAEHFACYYAGPASPETLEVMNRYGTPETVPDQGLTALRFDETAMLTNPDRRYKMFSFFSRHQSYPEFEHPDGYRLERLEEVAAQ